MHLPRSNAGASIGGGAVVIVVYVMQQFALELGKGNVPIPPEWQWTVPLIGALVAGLLAVLTPYFSTTEARTGHRRVTSPPDTPVITTHDPD